MDSQSNNRTFSPYSRHDQEILSNMLRRLDEDLFIKGLAGLGLAIIIAVLPTRSGDHLSMIGQYGWKKGLLIAVLLIGLPTLYFYFTKKRDYRKDLQRGAKIVQKATIVRKERSFSSKKCFIWVDQAPPEKQKFEVSLEIYEKLQKGQEVFLEFAPYSGYLLGIDWKV